MQSLFVPFAYAYDPVILWESYVYFTTDTLDTIEEFIAETYAQLVAIQSNVLLYLLPTSVQLLRPCTVLYGGLNSCLCECQLETVSLGTVHYYVSRTVLYGGLNSCLCECQLETVSLGTVHYYVSRTVLYL